MSRKRLEHAFVTITSESLPRQQDDGGMLQEPWAPMLINVWSLCYREPFADNPHHGDPAVRAAILRLGDFNAASCEADRGFTNNVGGWSLCSEEAPWTLRWPVYTTSPYSVLQRYDCVALAEAARYHRSTQDGACPTVTYRIAPDTKALDR